MERKDLLHTVQKLEFAMVELNLYLNAYPECEEALSYFTELKEAHNKAVAEYEAVCGPLTAGSNGTDSWDWVRTPWPWEMGVN